MYDPDPLRRTGRTTRMLNNAIIKHLEGFNVIVTAHSYKYSTDLQNIVCCNLEQHNVYFAASKYIITIGDADMLFTKHLDNDQYILNCTYIDHSKTYFLFEDHFRGNY